jgi:hypothetical protein
MKTNTGQEEKKQWGNVSVRPLSSACEQPPTSSALPRCEATEDSPGEASHQSCPMHGQDEMRAQDIAVIFTPAEAVLVVAALQARVKQDRTAALADDCPMAALHRIFIERGETVLGKFHRAVAAKSSSETADKVMEVPL